MINHAVQTPSSLAWDRLMSKGYSAEKAATDSAHDYMMTQTHDCLQEELCCFVFKFGRVRSSLQRVYSCMKRHARHH